MKKLVVLASCCALLMGCAPDVYLKDGATQADFNQDQGSCQMFVISGVPQVQPGYVPPTYRAVTYGNVTTMTPDYSGQAGANLGAAIGNAVRQRQAMRACMASRGYSLQATGTK